MKFPLDTPFRPRFSTAEWLVPGLLLAVSVALALAGDEARLLGRYERAGIEAGEWWRLASGHLVHLGTGHLVMNMAALGLTFALLHGALTAADWAHAAWFSALAIDAGLFWWSPEVAWYVGLSGVLHGLLAAGALRLLVMREWVGAVLIVGVVGKVAWEQRFGATPMSVSMSGGPVVVDAHLYGALGGGLAQLAAFGVRRLRAARL